MYHSCLRTYADESEEEGNSKLRRASSQSICVECIQRGVLCCHESVLLDLILCGVHTKRCSLLSCISPVIFYSVLSTYKEVLFAVMYQS